MNDNKTTEQTVASVLDLFDACYGTSHFFGLDKVYIVRLWTKMFEDVDKDEFVCTAKYCIKTMTHYPTIADLLMLISTGVSER